MNLFIEMIQHNELIWRKGHGNHKDKNKNDKIWLMIAEQCGFDDVKSAKQKWKHLCDYYSKLKKPKASGSGSDGKDVKWPYLNLMTFLEEEKENCSRIDSIQTTSIPNDVKDLLNCTISMSSSDDENEKIFTQKLPSKRRRLSDTDKDDAVDNCISKRGVSPEEQLIICLRFFATGMQYRALEYSFRRSRSTISLIVKRVSKAIWSLHEKYVKLPASNEEWKNIANGFEKRWNMPLCIGALDGKLVRLRKPNNSGSLYHDYKRNFSLNMLALCDFRFRIIYVDVGEYGYKGDANVFSSSSLKAKLNDNLLNIPEPTNLPGLPDSDKINYFIVADAAFPLSLNIMKPFAGNALSHKQRIYNYRISRARRVIENVFGIMCVKWRILLKPIETNIESANWIIRAIIVLHNFLIDESTTQKLFRWLIMKLKQNEIWKMVNGGTYYLIQNPFYQFNKFKIMQEIGQLWLR
uniref:MADF domain-containing protein n=1 Tax=Meloidogyne enterolobii TaxID=390850 RepID=A0A6V7UUK2_MELEN|nr:unnamed protein product [Meloidogyne enterolobii]